MTTDVAARLIDPDTADWARIEVGTPLPLSVAATLVQLVGAAWPNSVLITKDHPRFGWAPETALVMLVDHRKAPKRVGKRAAAALAAEVAPEPGEDVPFGGFTEEDGRLVMHAGSPEDLQKELGAIVHTLMSAYPVEQAPNYLEWTLDWPGDEDHPRARYVLCAARSAQQTPHALRAQAEAELARERAAHAALRARVEEYLADCESTMELHTDAVRALLEDPA
jgi:hypothetical protein